MYKNLIAHFLEQCIRTRKESTYNSYKRGQDTEPKGKRIPTENSPFLKFYTNSG